MFLGVSISTQSYIGQYKPVCTFERFNSLNQASIYRNRTSSIDEVFKITIARANFTR